MPQRLTEHDIAAIQQVVSASVQEAVQRASDSLREDFADLQSSVDSYLKRTLDWHQEYEVLRAQHNRLRAVLIEKGIATEEELSVISY